MSHILNIHTVLVVLQALPWCTQAEQSDLVISSTIEEIRHADIDQLNARMNRILREHTVGRSVEWRPNKVIDFRGYYIPSGAERLSRWDSRPPNTVFQKGLQPRCTQVYKDECYDLYSYVIENIPSLFVGTTRYYRGKDGRPARWAPLWNARYEYEVLANGGIDINRSLGPYNLFEEEQEIAFLGGIKLELIRSAREYKYVHGQRKLVRMIMNPYFDVSANGENQVNPAQIADIVVPPSCPIEYWSPPEIELLEAENTEEEESPQGYPLEDELMVGDMLAKPVRAAFLNPKNHHEIYFFAANRFALMQALPTPNKILQGPAIIEVEWNSFKNLGFAMVDAILPATSSNSLHVFSQQSYAQVNMDTNESLGPFTIANHWPSLREAGFSTVDAVLPHPKNDSVAYFFSGDSFAMVKSKPKDVLLSGPHIILEEWISLKNANFSTVDVAVPRPLNESEAYIFSGNQYAVVIIDPDHDEIFNAPLTRSIESCWQSILELGFYGDLLDGLPNNLNLTSN